MQHKRVLGMILVLGGVACARPAPPPGGPVDRTGPEVLSVSPDPLARGVPTDALLTIRFSESVDKKSVERALWISPGGTAKPRISFSGEVVTIHLGTHLPESTTVGVLLTTEVRDRKRESQQNPLRQPFRWIFSTGESIWPGVIRGSVEHEGSTSKERLAGQVLVAVYPAGSDTLPDLALFPPLAITETDSAGRFELAGLPTGPDLLEVVAVYDRDGNRAIRGRGEFVSAESETLSLSTGDPEQDLILRLVSPDAPGTLTGNLVRSAGDTVDVWLELFAVAAGDSASRPAKRVLAGPDGSFTLSGVPPRDYELRAFCDVNGNSQQDAEESTTVYGPVRVRPGTKFELGSWEIPTCPAGTEP